MPLGVALPTSLLIAWVFRFSLLSCSAFTTCGVICLMVVGTEDASPDSLLALDEPLNCIPGAIELQAASHGKASASKPHFFKSITETDFIIPSHVSVELGQNIWHLR